MKLYGSFVNRVQETMISVDPEVGIGVTEMCYSDRHAYTIVRVASNGKNISVQRDKAIRVDDRGITEAQDYRYERDTDAPVMELRLNKKGQWKLWHSPQGNTFMVGVRSEYFDFGF